MPSEDNKFDPFKFINQFFSSDEKAPPAANVSDKKRLLDELEVLSDSERVRRMYLIGKESINTDSSRGASAERVLAELKTGNFYERYLFLRSCAGSRDSGAVADAAKSDPSKKLRTLALSLVASTCDDDQVHAVFRDQSEKNKRRLVKMLRQHRRIPLIDILVETLNGQPSKLTNVLFLGSTNCVQKYLQTVSDRLSSLDMFRFASQHPKLASDYLTDCVNASTTLDPRLLFLTNAALGVLSKSHPDAAIQLVANLKRLVPASSLDLALMLRYRPNELVELLASHSELSTFNFERGLPKMNTASITKIIQANALKGGHHNWFAKLPVESRIKIYEHCSEGWRDGNGCLAARVIDKLPEPIRHSEAKRHLALPSLAARMQERLAYAKYLPWAEALETMQPVIDSSEVENRAIGFRCLIPTLRFQQKNSQELLNILVKRKNESDPVRLEMLSGLAQLPPSIWQKDDLTLLSTIIQDALSAADLSSASINNMGSLLLRLFRFHREWSTNWIVKIARDRGSSFLSGRNQFTKEELRFLADNLAPVVKYWESREEDQHIRSVARWYGQRLEEFSALVDALCDLCKKARAEWISLEAATTLRNNCAVRFNELVPTLLAADKSWAVKPIVIELLHRRRQDLLTPYLGQHNFTGRFSTGKTRIVPSFTNGFHRWSSNQQDIYATQLSLMAKNENGDVNNRIYGITRLCLLPEPPMGVLRALASPTTADDKSSVLRDYTINHLGELDAGQGMPILMEAVHDSRARLAIYSLRKSVLSMTPDAALEILAKVPSTKISVFKEVIRLIGELQSDRAFAWLLEQSRQNLQKDLQVALLRALWNYPDRNETWEVLEQSVASGNASYVDTAIRIPATSMSAAARENLLKLFRQAILCDDAGVRCRALLQAAYLPVVDSKHILLGSMLKSLSSNIPDESKNACVAFFRLYASRDQEVLKKGLVVATSNARALVRFLAEFENNIKRQREFILVDARALLQVLRSYPKTICWQIRIAASILDWTEFYQFLKEIDDKGTMNGDALNAAVNSFAGLEFRPDYNKLEELEGALGAEPSENLRRVALAILVTLGGSASGCTNERLAKLRQYREDSSVMVSAAAEFTLPPVEIQTVQG